MKFDAIPTIADALDSTLEAFRAGDFSRAEAAAESALAVDFEDAAVQSALKCAVFWKDRTARSAALPAPEQRGDFLLREWQGFVSRFRSHLDTPFDEGVEAIKGSIFDRAASSYLEQIEFEEPAHHYGLLLKAARAWKGNGSFDRALECLEKVLQAQPDAQALAEMADCLEAVGETSQSRLYFREAFYLNAQEVDLGYLQSEAVRGLAAELAEQGLQDSEVREWLPVHAVIRGIFNSKRELKPLELGQLKQSINSLKSELQGRPLLLPKLLYRYFWLIDHYIGTKDDRSKVEDVLLNIKLLDERIYDLYTH